VDELEAVVEALPVGVLCAGRDGTLTRVNARARELLRLDPEAPQPAWLATLLARALEREGGVRETVDVDGGDGSAVAIEIYATPVGGVGVVCTVADLTERARRGRADREFITDAAHQVRTPVAAIATAIEVLQGGAKNVPEARDRFLGHIELQTARLVRLSHAMLALARAERGDTAPVLGLVPLQPLLAALVDEAPVVPGVAVELECPPDLAVRADAPLLSEALANVLTNALEHTSAGDVRLGATESRGHVVVEITDTGSGISTDELPRVFERFRHGPGDGGVGLGLPIAQAALRVIGGTIEIESKEGTGTTVRVRLLGARVETAGEPPTAATRAPAKR
jgi:two-component system phosphate regulon sensor histidine kinase PhoR